MLQSKKYVATQRKTDVKKKAKNFFIVKTFGKNYNEG